MTGDSAFQERPMLERLTENLGAAEIDLTPDDLREIDRAASQITIQGHGTRVPGEENRL